MYYRINGVELLRLKCGEYMCHLLKLVIGGK